jgi:hypothetical protein
MKTAEVHRVSGFPGSHISRQSAHRRPEAVSYVRFEVFTAMTMKNVVFWNEEPHIVTQPKMAFFLSPIFLS